MRTPLLDRYQQYESIDLFSVKETEDSPKKQLKALLNIDSSINVTISEESRKMLSEGRENLQKYGVSVSRSEPFDQGDIDVSGQLMMEYYWEMNDAVDIKVHDAESFARDIIAGYKAVYANVMKMHENGGNREYISPFYGKGTFTLEEDLKGLNMAFNWKLDSYRGYISRPYGLQDPEYVESMVKKLEEERNQFVESYKRIYK